MFGIQISMIPMPKPVNSAVKKGAYKTLKHAAFSIRKSAIESMTSAKGPSKPGTPPHRHSGKLARSIRVEQEEEGGVFVGPSYSRVKVGGRPPWLAQMLEHGGTYTWKKKRKGRGRGRPKKGDEAAMQTVTFPARPFMQPALERNLARFHKDWSGAI